MFLRVVVVKNTFTGEPMMHGSIMSSCISFKSRFLQKKSQFFQPCNSLTLQVLNHAQPCNSPTLQPEHCLPNMWKPEFAIMGSIESKSDGQIFINWYLTKVQNICPSICDVFTVFLDAFLHLYNTVCPSVGPLACPSLTHELKSQIWLISSKVMVQEGM